MVFIQPPPQETSDPADVLKYLARYMTGGPISDRRLIEMKDGRVYFWARSKDKSGRQVRESLPTLEFVRSWTLHILPKGFTKARRYGGWSNTRQATYQQQCDRLQPVPPSTVADPADPVSDLPPDELPDAVIKCPHCARCSMARTIRGGWSGVATDDGPLRPLPGQPPIVSAPRREWLPTLDQAGDMD
jgi:hypothetical protein